MTVASGEIPARGARRRDSRIAERWQHLAVGVNPWKGCHQPDRSRGAAAAHDCWRRSAAPDGWGGAGLGGQESIAGTALRVLRTIDS